MVKKSSKKKEKEVMMYQTLTTIMEEELLKKGYSYIISDTKEFAHFTTYKKEKGLFGINFEKKVAIILLPYGKEKQISVRAISRKHGKELHNFATHIKDRFDQSIRFVKDYVIRPEEK